MVKINNKATQRSHRAYTVLEILLVVAVIAIMSLVGVKLIQTQTREAKIKVALSEINQYSQAGLSFYHLTNAWPTQTSDFNIYLPQLKNKKNPWGNDYRTNVADPRQGSFEVYTVVPDKIIADRLVAALPVAKTTAVAGGYQVSAYVGAAVPDQQPNLLLKGVGHGVSPGGVLGGWTLPGNGTYIPYVRGVNEFNQIDGSPSHATQAQTFYNQAATNANVISIAKPVCPAGYIADYKVFLTGYQKGCFLSNTGEIKQCDAECPTKAQFCNVSVSITDWAGVSYSTTRNAGDSCCKYGGLRVILPFVIACVYPHETKKWGCSNYGALNDYYEAQSGLLIVTSGNPLFYASQETSIHHLNDVMQSRSAFERSVSVTLAQETSTAWDVLVRTEMVKPGQTDILNLIWKITTGESEAFDNYNGELSYFTYCKLITP